MLHATMPRGDTLNDRPQAVQISRASSDVHRTFGEVVIWENGLARHEGRADMTRTALEGFVRQLRPTDEVVIEAMSLAIVLGPMAHMARPTDDWDRRR
jgi:hypothetical protein